ncbi:uncharacterized protein LOC111300434 [Durio zibethinus]|uniref:Uncharacterized protein LOC111300434 n=1 Tax=Durio zibethinus TaxID=66656 RepID=A0A6P5ZG88_DURZI|nr:uncharacterized protein LOC111300434 [Durio zibethinus]
MKMRRVVEWLITFFFVICCNALLCSSAEAAGHDLKPLMKEKQLRNVFKSQRTSFKGLHEALYVGKQKKLAIDDQNKIAKGTYTGGGHLRSRSKKNGANSLMLKSSSLLSALLFRYVIVGLLVTMFFF